MTQKGNNAKPLIPYLRQSRAKERTISIEDQRRDIVRWAEAAGVRLAPEIVEQNVSGNKPWRSRGLGRAIEACERGEAGGIVVAWQDRLSRENMLGTAEVWTALQEADARIVAANEGGDIDRLLYVVKAEVARQQWERYQANFVSAKHAVWERGVYVGSAPAGFEKVACGHRTNGDTAYGLQPSDHAPAVAAAIKLRATGGSWTEVARALAGVPTSKGRTDWNRESAKAALRNPVYKGEHHCTCGCGSITTRGDWVIVTPSVWKRAQPIAGEAPVGRQDRGQALLGGLLDCAGCGRRMSRSHTKVGGIEYRYYRCTNRPVCKAPATIMASAIEPLVVDAALHALGTVEGPAVDLTGLEARVEQAEAAYQAAADMLGIEELPAGSRQAQEVEAARGALAEADPGAALILLGPEGVDEGFGFETAEAFARMTVEARRALLRQLIGRVRVGKGRMPVAEKVAITLADGRTWEPVEPTIEELVAA